MRRDPSRTRKSPLPRRAMLMRLAGASVGYVLLGRMLEWSGLPPEGACWVAGLGVAMGMTALPPLDFAWPARRHDRLVKRLEAAARRSTDLAGLSAAVLDAFHRATQADQILLWLPPPGDTSLHLSAGIGQAPETMVIPEFSLRSWLSEGDLAPRLVPPPPPQTPSVFDQILLGIGASACIPLMLHDRLLGLITLGRDAGQPFQDRDLQGLEGLTHQAALALAPHQLQEEQRLQHSKLEAVSRLYLDAQKKAVTDGLTGLITHAHFKEQLASRFFEARRFDQPLSLMFIDIDHFKRINDTYGHQTGDEVLRQVSRVIQERVRACDVAARYGGEELAVLLPQTDLSGALILAERMREAIGDLTVTDLRGKAMVRVTASIGVSELEPDDRAPADLIERADQAVYRAKHQGRNQVIAWSPSLPV